jgi:hypothetical protein
MRFSPYLLAAVAGFGLIVLSTPRADALTSASPAGLRAGLEALDLTEPVHCRRAVHKHRHGHGFSRGCRAGVVVIRRPGYVVREGVIIRDRRPSNSVNIGIGSGRSGSTSGSATPGTSAPAAAAPAPAASGKTTGSATTSAPAATAPAPAASGKTTGSATPSAPAATAPAPAASGSAPAEQKK